MRWSQVPFESIFLTPLKNGLTRPSKVRGSGIPMINMGELFAHDRIGSIEMELVPVNDRELSSMLVEKGDLLFARQSLVLSGAGKCSFVQAAEVPTTFESHIIRVRLNQVIANPLFFHYYFKSPSCGMTSIVTQGVQAGIRGSDLKQLPVSLPPLDVQNRIAESIAQYDDLIENNRRRMELLEEAARQLYREWFVRLRFSGHEHTRITNGVPEGWERVSTPEAIEINPTTRLSDETEHWSVEMADLPTDGMVIQQATKRESRSGSKFRNGDTLFARITPCLENGKTAFVDFLENGETARGSTEFMVLRGKRVSPEYVYCLARTHDFRGNAIKSMIGSSGRQRVQESCFEKFLVLVPTSTLLTLFTDFARPQFRQVKTLHAQNQKLRAARDLLLPRLMSGEITV
jgi:type I restriction enzyme, S subunit